MRKNNCFAKANHGFTLIELIIVVAIIALLSAIAVPNFLDARVRAKVSRVKADLKAVGTALETYRTDYRGYPVVGNLAYPGSWDMDIPYARRLKVITTPIAYIQKLPVDVFSTAEDLSNMGQEYCYSPGNFYHGASARYSGAIYRNSIYSIAGRGPDKVIGAGGYCLAHPAADTSGLRVHGVYDPTNGTTSDGDLFQVSCGRL